MMETEVSSGNSRAERLGAVTKSLPSALIEAEPGLMGVAGSERAAYQAKTWILVSLGDGDDRGGGDGSKTYSCGRTWPCSSWRRRRRREATRRRCGLQLRWTW